MEQAELELGFETHESQLCIEAVTDVEQGFVITITRIDDDNDFESIHKFIKTDTGEMSSEQKGEQPVCAHLL